MTRWEIEGALEAKKTLVWDDPDPIEGADYRIIKAFDFTKDTCMITYGYGKGNFSEAEVYLHEIRLM